MADLIESLRKRHDFLVSTDIVGTHGNPLEAYDFWRIATQRQKIGLEVIAWTHLLNRRPHFLAENAPLVGGFHGRLGVEFNFRWSDPIDWMKILLLNSWIDDNHDLQERASVIEGYRPEQELLYVLNHTPGAQEWLAEGNVYVLQGVTMAVENHNIPNGFTDAQKMVAEFRRREFSTELVFDVVHSLRSRPKEKDYTRNWQIMLDELREAGRCLIHLPVGTNKQDSIDFKQVTPEMWRQLASLISENESYSILEHQQASLMDSVRYVPLAPQNNNVLVRAIAVVDVLREHKILPGYPIWNRTSLR